MMLIFVKHLKFVTFITQPFDALGKYLLEFVDASEGVVEGDDGTVTRVVLHILVHFFGREAFGVVACDQVPHHDGVVATKTDVLGISHPSSWGTEEIGLNQFVGFVGIAQIALARHGDATNVVEGVIAQAMTMGTDEFEQFWIFPDIVAHHEESRFHVVAIKRLNQPRGRFGDGPVVEGQIDCLLRRVHSPDGTGIEPS